jgi:hypothetical protein
LIALVRAATVEEMERTVPAGPDWRVRDVLAHVAGLTADLNGGDLGPGDPDAWTARQIDRFRAGAVETGIETRVVGPGDVAASVSTEPFEMLRACAGRRTADAIAAYRWAGDVDAFIGRISRYETPTTGVGV